MKTQNITKKTTKEQTSLGAAKVATANRVAKKSKRDLDEWAKSQANYFHFIDSLGPYKLNWTLPFIESNQLDSCF